MGLSLARNVKIGFFHLGSGMADVLVNGLWNRVMISDLGYSATPVGLLLGLRYFLAPLGVWAGRMSDAHQIHGWRRLVWIQGGRALMALGLFLLGLATASLARGAADTLPLWLLITFAMLLFSLGNALSGSTFLALIHDRAREEQRGRAVGLVWTFLLLGFTVGGALFAIMLPSAEGAETGFSPAALLRLFALTAAGLAALWFFSLLGEERRHREPTRLRENDTALRADLRLAWRAPVTRHFLIYLTLSMFCAFAQDLVLEPFAGDVLDMPVAATTRFAAWWGGMSIFGSLLALGLARRVKALDHRRLARLGALMLMLSFALFALSGLGVTSAPLYPGLLLMGLGLGIWNIGTLGLMMDLSPPGRAGSFLGFWTLVVTFARGGGVSGGGLLRDLALLAGGNPGLAYATVFLVALFGLGLSLRALGRVDARHFAANGAQAERVAALAGALD